MTELYRRSAPGGRTAMGRRAMLAFAAGAALVPLPLGRATAEAAGPPLTVAPPEGWSAIERSDPRFLREGGAVADVGLDMIGLFEPGAPGPFDAAVAAGDAAGRPVRLDAYRALVTAMEMRMAPYLGRGTIIPLRHEADEQSWLWVGVIAGTDGFGPGSLTGLGLLWLDGLHVLLHMQGESPSDESAAGVAGWAVLSRWAAAIRAANTLHIDAAPAPPRYDLAGVIVELPAPAGFEPVRDPSYLERLRTTFPEDHTVETFVPIGGAPERFGLSATVYLQTEARSAVMPRAVFEQRRDARRDEAQRERPFDDSPGHDGVADGGVIDIVEGRDSITVLRVERRGEMPALWCDAMVWVEGDRIMDLTAGTGRTPLDAAQIAAATPAFRAWAAAVVAANGGA